MLINRHAIQTGRHVKSNPLIDGNSIQTVESNPPTRHTRIKGLTIHVQLKAICLRLQLSNKYIQFIYLFFGFQ